MYLGGKALRWWHRRVGYLPLLERFRRRLDAAWVLRALALAVQGGRPPEQPLAILARGFPRWPIRRKLRKVLKVHQHGGDWCEALIRCHLITRAEGALLNSARQVGNLGWAAGELAARVERQVGYRLQGLLRIALPVVVVVFGLFTLALAWGVLAPIVEIIRTMA